MAYVNRNGFLAVLEAEKSKVRVPADLVCVQILFLVHRDPPLHPHRADRAGEFSRASSRRPLIPLWGAPLS